MNIPIWIRSEYVTYIGIALLSFVWRGAPPIKEQAHRLSERKLIVYELFFSEELYEAALGRFLFIMQSIYVIIDKH